MPPGRSTAPRSTSSTPSGALRRLVTTATRQKGAMPHELVAAWVVLLPVPRNLPLVSRNGVLLPLPAGYVLPPWPLPAEWVEYAWRHGWTTPRSAWLGLVEEDLKAAYPLASTADAALTARTLAPFPLAQPGVR